MTSDALSVNRMADPVVRRRVACLLAGLVAVTWMAVHVGAHASGPFSQAELRDIGCAVPFRPPQIEQCVGPEADPVGDLGREIQQLQQQVKQPPPGLAGN